MHVILTGATGLVGSGVLDSMLHVKELSKITILSRREVPQAVASGDPRINTIIHKDFNTYDSALLEQLRGASGVVWALGISQTQVAADEYVKITKDYTLKAAEAFAELGLEGKPFRFVYVSGEGATQTPGRFSQIFARVKGETEQALADLTAAKKGKLQANSVRLAFVDASSHEAVKSYVPEKTMMMKVLTTTLGPPIRTFMKSFHSPTDESGLFLTRMAMGVDDAKYAGSGAIKLGPSWVFPNAIARKVMAME